MKLLGLTCRGTTAKYDKVMLIAFIICFALLVHQYWSKPSYNNMDYGAAMMPINGSQVLLESVNSLEKNLKSKSALVKEWFCVPGGSECYAIVDKRMGSVRELLAPRTHGSIAAVPLDKNSEPVFSTIVHEYIKISIAVHFVLGPLYNNIDMPARFFTTGVGLGSCLMSLVNMNQNYHVTGVEISPYLLHIGRKWFGLRESSRAKVEVGDAVDYVFQAASNGVVFDALVIDVCYAEMVGQTHFCPIDAFWEPKFVEALAKTVSKDGLVSINYVGERRTEHIRSLLKVFVDHFNWCGVVTTRDGANSVLFCGRNTSPRVNKFGGIESGMNPTVAALLQLNHEYVFKTITKPLGSVFV